MTNTTKLIHTVKRFFRLLHHPSLKVEAAAEWSLERATQLWGDPYDPRLVWATTVKKEAYLGGSVCYGETCQSP